MPTKNSTKTLPHFPAGAERNQLDGEVARSQAETAPRFAKIAKYTGAAALAATLHAGALFATDVSEGIKEGKARVGDERAIVHEIYEFTDDESLFAHHGTFVMTGLGTKNASETAETLVAHRAVGDVYAIEYSNKELNTADIAARIIEQAEAAELKEVSLDGYSMGGPIAIDVATHIQEKTPELKVVGIVLNSSPVGENGLTKRSEDGVRMMERVLSLHEDLVYYEKGRVGVELVARHDRYLQESSHAASERTLALHGLSSYSYRGTRYEIDWGSARHELADIRERLRDPDVAAAQLIRQQADVLKLDLKEKIRQLDSATQIIYTRSEHADGDDVVDIEASEENLVTILERYKKEYEVIHEDVQHANPAERRTEYDRMIRRQIQPAITGQIALRALERSGDTLQLSENAE